MFYFDFFFWFSLLHFSTRFECTFGNVMCIMLNLKHLSSNLRQREAEKKSAARISLHVSARCKRFWCQNETKRMPENPFELRGTFLHEIVAHKSSEWRQAENSFRCHPCKCWNSLLQNGCNQSIFGCSNRCSQKGWKRLANWHQHLRSCGELQLLAHAERLEVQSQLNSIGKRVSVTIERFLLESPTLIALKTKEFNSLWSRTGALEQHSALARFIVAPKKKCKRKWRRD